MPPFTFQSTQHLFRTLGNAFPVTRYFAEIETQNFRNLLLADLQTINTRVRGDEFFQEHGVFIQSYHVQSQPYLGYRAWMQLLDILQELDPRQYRNIHKGTAYYHAAIFALKSNRFLEGLELMDYGYTTDLKINPNASSAPGGLYIGLGYPNRGNDWDEGERLDHWVRYTLDRLPAFQNRRFNILFLSSRAKKYFLTRRSGGRRSAWVSLLASLLGRMEVQTFMKITPAYGEGQTIPKFDLTSLCLILETLLTYSPEGKRGNTIMLEPLFQALIDSRLPAVRSHRQTVYRNLKSLPYSKWNHRIDHYISAYGQEVVAFSLAWVLRNKVNHIFLDKDISLALYNKVFDLLVYAIFVSLKLLYTP